MMSHFIVIVSLILVGTLMWGVVNLISILREIDDSLTNVLGDINESLDSITDAIDHARGHWREDD